MRNFHLLIARLWVALFLASVALGVEAAEVLAGRVVGVLDGDTIDVLTSEKRVERIRLMGIDAPEKKQAFGQRAKQHLSDLVYGAVVVVQWQHRDRNKRVIGKVLLAGHDVNLAMVRDGFAWWYVQFQREQTVADRNLYYEFEQAARKKKTGLWVDSNPIPPWEYRHTRKESR